jgi:tetratricopeptide (TPR) repeat protein
LNMRNKLPGLMAGSVLIAIALIYWPAIHGKFVWIDVPDFVQMTWLRQGDAWKHYIFKDFDNWVNYFRPLVVGLFTLQLRLFNSTPGPMHVVSITIHLINTLLIGLLARQCSQTAMRNSKQQALWLIVPMLLYGLHPVLAESVAWISCQFDLIVTLFMLLGLLANTCIEHPSRRAITVAACFFLAACAKESAAAFPLTLAVFEWARQPWKPKDSLLSRVGIFIARNWQVYLALLVAGIAYLAFRYWALGQLVDAESDGTLSTFSRLQEASFTYLHYWEMLFWPMHGMSPIHDYSAQQFLAVTPISLLIDAAAIGIAAASLYLAIRHSSPMACVVLAMTVTLLPVLHIIPAPFAPSLYHDRYVITSLAVMCAMLPLIRLPAGINALDIKLLRPVAITIGCFWLLLSIIDIRMTVPLWSNDIALWRWALVMDPDSIFAKSSLLNAYINDADYKDARKLTNQMLAEHTPCTTCMLGVAILALDQSDPARAQQALDVLKNTKGIALDQQIFGIYLTLTGQMLKMQGKLDESEATLRQAMTVTPFDAKPPMLLALTLARKGKESDARAYAEHSIAMFPPEQRDTMRRKVDIAIEANLELAKQSHSYKAGQ